MKALLTLPFAVGLTSCSMEENVSVHQSGIYFGTVKDTNTAATLSTFCRYADVVRSSAIVFSAAPGSLVEEEIFFEWREEKFAGSIPPERDEAFWCGAAPVTYQRPTDYWICLHSTDVDPPATILAVERRGELGQKASSGYALKLEVRHPGVLHVAFNAPCLAEHSHSYPGGVPGSWGELTIQ